MKNNKIKIRKICSLYINDWHLTTMILPHIGKQLKEKTEVATILETGIKNNIQEILSKMNLNQEINNKIMKINWTSNDTCKYEEIEKQIHSQKIEIIVKGTQEYIENANKMIEKIINKNNIKEISIINCYDVTNYKDISEILRNHEYIMNTAGIKPVSYMLDTNSTSSVIDNGTF